MPFSIIREHTDRKLRAEYDALSPYVVIERQIPKRSPAGAYMMAALCLTGALLLAGSLFDENSGYSVAHLSIGMLFALTLVITAAALVISGTTMRAVNGDYRRRLVEDADFRTAYFDEAKVVERRAEHFAALREANAAHQPTDNGPSLVDGLVDKFELSQLRSRIDHEYSMLKGNPADKSERESRIRMLESKLRMAELRR